MFRHSLNKCTISYTMSFYVYVIIVNLDLVIWLLLSASFEQATWFTIPMTSVRIKSHQPGMWNGISSDQFTESRFMCYGHIPPRIICFALQPSTPKRWASRIFLYAQFFFFLMCQMWLAAAHKGPSRIYTDSIDGRKEKNIYIYLIILMAFQLVLLTFRPTPCTQIHRMFSILAKGDLMDMLPHKLAGVLPTMFHQQSLLWRKSSKLKWVIVDQWSLTFLPPRPL